MENPVNYNELFSPTLKEDIRGLIDEGKEVETTLTNMIATLTPKAQELANALSGSNSATSAGRSATNGDGGKHQSSELPSIAFPRP